MTDWRKIGELIDEASSLAPRPWSGQYGLSEAKDALNNPLFTPLSNEYMYDRLEQRHGPVLGEAESRDMEGDGV